MPPQWGNDHSSMKLGAGKFQTGHCNQKNNLHLLRVAGDEPNYAASEHIHLLLPLLDLSDGGEVKGRSLQHACSSRPASRTSTPPNEANEPEDIDAWALMAGLEDHSPLLAAPFGRHSFSFPVTTVPQDLTASAKVTQLPMPRPNAALVIGGEGKPPPPPPLVPPRRAVLYFTWLRGVRATYEDCRLARAILKGYGVRLDERDVSMHRGFRDELRGLLGLSGGALTKCWAPAAPAALPSLFVDGELVGNAEELMRLHEAGELAARLAGSWTKTRRRRKATNATTKSQSTPPATAPATSERRHRRRATCRSQRGWGACRCGSRRGWGACHCGSRRGPATSRCGKGIGGLRSLRTVERRRSGIGGLWCSR